MSRPGLLTEEEARLIAAEFVANALPHVPRCDGARYEGGPDARWVFFFKIPVPEGGVIDPSHWIVEVDVATRVASFFYVM